MSDPIDWEAGLSDLRGRRDRLNVAIGVIEQEVLGRAPSDAEGAQPPAMLNGPPNRETGKTSIPPDAFFSLSVPEAARKYLSMVKRPAGAKEMEQAIREGGFQTVAKNFYANLYTSLVRSKDTFVKVGKKWGLVEWYPRRPKKTDANGSKADSES
jgi:hypothetical protein